MLSITRNEDGNKLTLTLSGRLDTIAAADLEMELMDGMEDVKELIFECKELEYVSSAGLRVFLNAQDIMDRQGTMLLCHVSEEVKEIFEVTGFDEILRIENT